MGLSLLTDLPCDLRHVSSFPSLAPNFFLLGGRCDEGAFYAADRDGHVLWTCFRPSVPGWQRGGRPPEEILGHGTEPGLPRGWAASSPSQANTKPGLLFDLASCTLFSLQSRELILLPLSQAISTYIIPGGLLLAALSRSSQERPLPAPIRAASAGHPWLLVRRSGRVTGAGVCLPFSGLPSAHLSLQERSGSDALPGTSPP